MESDILKILTCRKTATCRAYPLKVGQLHKCMVSFKVFAVVKVTKVTYISNIEAIDHPSIKKLGYKTRKAYLNESFNKNNESKERYFIEFEVIENRINDYINKWM